ncbi:DUF1569 domain-containing protein [Novipirellula rosea]|uniref:DUF1569 domain-containing protein n=1 Tax=Novipirellula rosea TaxID=1031540 RepID=A0ABP8MTN0_9BACT
MGSSTKHKLDFHTGDEVVAEIERLRRGGYTRSKNWNLTQICEHLTHTMTGGMEGFGFRLPWILRATIVNWIVRRILRTRRMSSAPTIERLKPKSPSGADDDRIIDHCIEVIRRAEKYEGSFEDYPFIDNFTADEWRQFMWLHAAHHLGFLIPKDQAKS